MPALWCQLTTVKPIVFLNDNLQLWHCCFHLGYRLEWGLLFAILYLATERIEHLIRNEPCARNPNGKCWRGVYRHVHLCVELQRKWEFLDAVWFNTSVSLAAVPAFHDSAFHHLKHVIAFDDNKRIVAREHSSFQKHWAASASGPVNFGRHGIGTGGFSDPKGVPKGEGLGVAASVHLFSEEEFMGGDLSTI